MQRKTISDLPDEILLQCFLQVKDLTTISRLAQVSDRFNRLTEDVETLSSCSPSTISVVDALIAAIGAQENVNSGKLSKRLLLTALLQGNYNQLKALILPYEKINLVYASYEARRSAFFANSNNKRNFYLSEDIARQNTYNVSSVRRFATASLAISEIDFSILPEVKILHAEVKEESDFSFENKLQISPSV